jgi:molecular chaperone GrpE
MENQNTEKEEPKTEQTQATNESATEQQAEAIEETNHPDDVEATNEEKSETKEDSAEAKINELNDRYLRLYSEFENFRRRSSKEKLTLLETASFDVIKSLLPVLDDMERAIKSNETIEDIDSVKEGFTLVYNKLQKTLESKGLKPMDALEQPFDVDYHEALTKIPAPTEELKGKVVDVLEKGYMVNDKIVRFAKVVIGE